MPVIDASLYIALINANEPHHDRSWAWFKDAAMSHQPLTAPTILLAEVAAALSRGIGEPQLALGVVRQLEGASLIDLVPVTLSLASRAAEIAAEHRIRGCDAVYVALAEQTNDRLVTLDNQQLQRAAAVVETGQP
jgi:predicted nucleic acid-binding protein